MRPAAASGTEALRYCAQTPAPDRCMHYLPDSSDTPRPAGGGKEKHSSERERERERKFDADLRQFALIIKCYFLSDAEK